MPPKKKKIKVTEAEALGIAISAVKKQIISASFNPSPAVTEALEVLTRLHNKASKPRITIASAKAKGRALPTKARQDLIDWLGIDPKDIKVTPGGCSGIDLYLSPAARARFPFGVECKNVEKLNFWSAWEQAEKNASSEGLGPMLIMKRNASLPILAVPWNEALIKRLADEAPS